MEQRNIFQTKYVSLDWYTKGVFFGIGKLDDTTIGIILPFLVIEIHLPEKKKPNEL
jgi:hypothetical protein